MPRRSDDQPVKPHVKPEPLIHELLSLVKPSPKKLASAQATFLADLVVRSRYRVFNHITPSDLDALLKETKTRSRILRHYARVVKNLMGEWRKMDKDSLFHYDYTRLMFLWLGPIALRDPLVRSTVEVLELATHWEPFQLDGRVYMRGLLEGLLKLSLPSLKGHKAKPEPDRLLAEHEQITVALESFPIKEVRNSYTIKQHFKERFPELSGSVITRLAVESLDERRRYSKSKIALLILGIRHRKAPETIRDWLIAAKKQEVHIKPLVKTLSQAPFET